MHAFYNITCNNDQDQDQLLLHIVKFVTSETTNLSNLDRTTKVMANIINLTLYL